MLYYKSICCETKGWKENLKENELFFSAPYSPIYYYLTEKRSPTRQTIFFDHINIPKKQEKKIVSDLKNKPNFVKITKAGFYESMVHNVDEIKKETKY